MLLVLSIMDDVVASHEGVAKDPAAIVTVNSEATDVILPVDTSCIVIWPDLEPIVTIGHVEVGKVGPLTAPEESAPVGIILVVAHVGLEQPDDCSYLVSWARDST